MDSVLIVSGSDKEREVLVELCRSSSLSRIDTVADCKEARNRIRDSEFELVIINTPLTHDDGCELAIYLAENSCSGILILVKSELADEVSAEVENYGVFVLQKPISRSLFFQAIKLISASCKRFQGLKNQKVKLESKIDEIKLVNRAKCALIQYLSMSESQAHRYIEKQAMDMRLPKKEIAESILNTYEY